MRSKFLLVSAAAMSMWASSVPEPTTWAMMLAGFGGIGFAMRRMSKVNTKVALG